MQKEKLRAVYILQLPPPIHGVSMMNSYVVKSKSINEFINPTIIDLKFSTDVKNLEKFSVGKVFTAASYCWKIFRTMVAVKPAIVYFTLTPTGFGFYRDAVYVTIIKLFRTELVLHLHGKGIARSVGKSLIKGLYKFVFRNTHVISLSKELAKDVSQIYKGSPYLVANGIPEEEPPNLTDRVTSGEPVNLLYLSNFIRSKGIMVLMDALVLLKTKGINFHIRFVGSQGDVTNDMLEHFVCENNLSNQVTVVGPLYGEEKHSEYRKADLFVFPSYNDSFPLVVIEAMQYALPVISTDEGSIPDIVEDGITGLIARRSDVVDLAHKLEILIPDLQKRLAMGKNGMSRYMRNFTIDHFETNLLKVFKSVLSKSSVVSGIAENSPVPVNSKL